MKRRLLGRTGASYMALAVLFMMSGGMSTYADEVSVETPLTAQEEAVPAVSLDTMASKNADATLKVEADGKLTLTIRVKDGCYSTDSPFARNDNSNVVIRGKSDNTTMVYNYGVSIYGDVTDSYTISAKGETVVLASSKLTLNIDNLKNATATLGKSEGVIPLDNVIPTLNADEKTAFESVPYAVINGKKCAMRSFTDEKAMYTLSIMNIHKDTTIEVYGTTAPTEARGTLDRTKVTGYVNEEIISYSTITLTNVAFHKLTRGSDISSWSYSLPKGMRVTAADGITKGDTRMQMKFCGKPMELSNASIDIMIEDQYIISSNNGILKVDPAGSTWFIQARMKTPVTTKGNQTYTMGSNEPLELTCSGELRDLYDIFINGSALSSGYYTLTFGSTVLTLKPEYLNTLEKGSYTVHSTYYDGSCVEAKFTVGDKKQEASKQANQEKAPNTADATSTGLLLVTLLTFGIGMAAISAKRKRARQQILMQNENL